VLTVIELLQELIRFDTTNPPGNEAECIPVDALEFGAEAVWRAVQRFH